MDAGMTPGRPLLKQRDPPTLQKPDAADAAHRAVGLDARQSPECFDALRRQAPAFEVSALNDLVPHRSLVSIPTTTAITVAGAGVSICSTKRGSMPFDPGKDRA